MKIKTAIILTIITFLIITSTSLFVLDHTIPKEVTPIMYDFHVNRDTSGFHAAPDALHFGTIIEGNSNSKRTFTVSNNESFNKKIEIFIAPLIPKEPITSWFTIIPYREYVLKERVSKKFKIVVSPPYNVLKKNETVKFFRGYVILKIYKAWPWEKPTQDSELLSNTFFSEENLFKNRH